MALAKDVLGVVPGLQATSIVAMNIPKKFPMKPTKIAKPNKNLIRQSVGTITGIAMMRPTATMINQLPD
jgi:hypothetical protein